MFRNLILISVLGDQGNAEKFVITFEVYNMMAEDMYTTWCKSYHVKVSSGEVINVSCYRKIIG